MKILQAVLFAFALMTGVAIGYMFNPSVEEPVPAKSVKTKPAINDAGDEATIATLRARIAELEAKLAKREGPSEMTEEKLAERKPEQRGRGGWGGLSPKEWREKMKKENPQQYIQMTNGMARWRRECLERAQKKVDFLSSIDVSKMSASARKTHDELQELIARREEMEQKMHERQEEIDELTPEARHAMWQEIRDVDQQIRDLNARERENLMLETVKNLGFSSDEASAVAETFQEIIENTEGGFNPTGRPGRGNGGQGGGMPPPPPAR